MTVTHRMTKTATYTTWRIAHRALTYRLRKWPLHKAMTAPKQGARP